MYTEKTEISDYMTTFSLLCLFPPVYSFTLLKMARNRSREFILKYP
jgi:hypothetical protein